MAPTLQSSCGLSLRTCTIILASVCLAYTLGEISISVMLEMIENSGHSDEAFREEDFPELSSEHHLQHNRSERSYEESDAFYDSAEMKEIEERLRQFQEEYRVTIITVIVFTISTIILMLVNLVSLSVLIYGAAKSKTACIRQWLVVGGLVIINDILNSLVLQFLGVHFMYTLAIFLDTPVAIWLWVVAWSLGERCRDLDKRNATQPLSMAALLENGDGQSDGSCTVSYNVLK